MNSAVLATLLAVSVTATGSDCTRSNDAGVAKPAEAAVAYSRCRVVSASELVGRTGLEFVDVRSNPDRSHVDLRRLSLAQLADRPVAEGVTRVLLGNGLDDDALAERCTAEFAESSIVLLGGVKAWNIGIRDPAHRRAGEEEFSAVTAADALSSNATFVFERQQQALASALLKADRPLRVHGTVGNKDSETLVFLDQALWRAEAGEGDVRRFYLLGGAQALQAELALIDALANVTNAPLKRPCYLP